jgi:hypothetical protein
MIAWIVKGGALGRMMLNFWLLGRAVRPALLVVAALALATMTLGSNRTRPADIRVSVEQQGDGALRITYDLKKPRRALLFGALAAGHRARRWEIETPGFALARLDDGDRITRNDGAKFNSVVLTASPDLIRIQKDYQPIAAYGEGGVMVYTGHFWPLSARGGRVNTTFSFIPKPGAKAVAFGARADRLVDWRSPMAHPAFIYMGPLQPVETREVMAVVDGAAPQWISDEFYALTPRIFSHLAGALGFSLAVKPNLFLAAPLGREQGRLSYSGDALPAQFQITLEGGAWRERSFKALGVFRRSTIHEAVHLWQAAARPGSDKVAGWIHEGAADAIAAETLLALGLWDAADYTADFDRAREECASELKGGPLATAEARGRFRALYACGHVIAVAVSWADGETVSDFWKGFIAEAKSDGYDESDFYDFVAKRGGERDFVAALRYFIRTPLANPSREVRRLLDAAGYPPLEPFSAR